MPASSLRLPRPVVVVLAVCAVVALGAAGRRLWQEHEDAHLRHLLRSFPVPAGYRAGELYLTGGGCDINFTCSRRIASLTLVPRSGSPACFDLQQGIRAWKGYVPRKPTSAEYCQHNGRIGGRLANGRLFFAPVQGRPASIVIEVSGSTQR